MTPTYFSSPAEFRAWLATHHTTTTEVLVGFYKVASGTPSMTWPESVDEALCVGWIDGIRRRVDDQRYTIRFTPRRKGSIWSAVNIARVGELTRLRRMRAAGLAAFALRDEQKSAIYAYEARKTMRLEPAHEKMLRANTRAWAFFQAQPPWFQRQAVYRVVSAKLEATRLERLKKFISEFAAGRRA